MRQVIMIGGIHGVGKSYLCKKLKDLHICGVYSASNLMRDYVGQKVDESKQVKNIEENQNILINAIDEYVKNERLIILDGHFCLMNQQKEIIEIPLDTFSKLNIKAIVVLIDDENNIIKRISERDRINYSFDYIENFQRKEVEHAIKIAEKLKAEFLLFNINDDIKKIVNLIQQIS
ncbi:adenylate kinase [Anaerosporobacter mobilis DSM 15930]|jgi:adenylate kinase|uniref:Adenylate kinase n=1 Tax=Anaerosporobacter mobilis DSM 15930 TaxID=1120996 RepID=A0A1M7MYM0_9FIRM|nr:ATP-binding protein [Anaerosporobacter mobilis]SHM95751.1 adenylate kinase [Anaerosporobacter mobilis DSM 15930]